MRPSKAESQINSPVKKILIVEDEWISGLNIRQMLEPSGYEVAGHVDKYSDVLSFVENNDISLILMDIKLRGELDGISIAEELAKTRNIPVIFITAYADNEIITRAKITAPAGYLIKPFTQRELLSAIEIGLYRHQIEQQVNRLNQVLNTVNEINRLIVKTDDIDTLLTRAVEILAENGNYPFCWIKYDYFPESKIYSSKAETNPEIDILFEKLREGLTPQCLKEAMEPEDVSTHGSKRCSECPLNADDPVSHEIFELRSQQQSYGYLGIATYPETNDSADEEKQLKRVVQDLIYAIENLHKDFALKRNQTIQQAFSEISKTYIGNRDLPDLFESVVSSLAAVVDFDHIVIMQKTSVNAPSGVIYENPVVLSGEAMPDISFIESQLKTADYKPVLIRSPLISAHKQPDTWSENWTQPETMLAAPVMDGGRYRGSVIISSNSGNVWYNQDDETLLEYFCTHVNSILSQYEHQYNLVKERSQLRMLMENIPADICFKNRKLQYLIANRSFTERLTGKPDGEVIGMTDFDFFPEELANEYRQEEIDLMDARIPILDRQIRSENRSGEKWHSVSKIPLIAPNDEVRGVVEISRDITAVKKASQEKQKLLFQNVFINRLSLKIGKYVSASDIYRTIYEEVRSVLDISEFLISYFDAENQEITVACMIINDQEIDASAVSPVKLGHKNQGLQDEVIRTGKLHYTGHSSKAANPGNTHDRLKGTGTADGRSGQVNDLEQSYESALCLPLQTSGEIIGLLQIQSHLRHAFSQDDIGLMEAVTNVAAIALQNARLFNEIQKELEQHKKTQDKLIKSESNYRFLADNSVDMIWRMDLRMRFTYVSPAAKHILGYDPHELTGTKLSEISSRLDFISMARQMFTALKKYREFRYTVFESNLIHADGHTVPVEIVGRLMINSHGMPSGIFGSTRDITERKKVEHQLHRYQKNLEELVEKKNREAQEKHAQLIHSGRLAAMGEMATNIAHEINQPLAIIQLQIEMLQSEFQKISKDPDIRIDEFKLICNQIKRASGTIEKMRSYTHDTGSIPVLCSLAEIIRDSESFFLAEFNTIGIQYVLQSSDIPDILVDPQHFRQIVLNLISNSRYAVLKKLDSNPDFKPEIKVSLKQKKTSKTIRFSVRDNGIGMQSEELQRCLEPFFTLRDVGEGTGLGLTIVNNLVREMKGQIEIDSKPASGTVVYITIPYQS